MRASAPMRAVVLLLTMVVGLCALTACGSSEGAGVEGASRTIEDIDGVAVEVPADPQRVVALSEPTLDGALALGVTPVGTVAGRGQSTVPAYLAEQAGDIEILGSVAQPNYEAIGAADPDLILVDGTSINNNPPVLEALARIAPVVYTGYAGGDWRANLRVVADALNRVDEGEQVIADYDARVGEVSAELADYADKTFSVVRWQGNSAALILRELLAGQALTDLGLQRPPSQDRDGRGHSEPVSLENLEQIDADYIFFGSLGLSSVDNPDAGGVADVSGAEAALAEAAEVPGFTDLQAYQADTIIPVDGSVWTSTGGPLLMQRLIDDVRAALVAP